MATTTATIAAGSHDGVGAVTFGTSPLFFQNGNNGDSMSYTNTAGFIIKAFYHFTVPSIPNGATVTSAKLKNLHGGANPGGPGWKIRAHDTADAPVPTAVFVGPGGGVFNTGNLLPTAKTFSELFPTSPGGPSARGPADESGPGSGVDITAIVSTLFGSYDYSSGSNKIGLRIQRASTTNGLPLAQLEMSEGPNTDPTIEIVYTAGGGGPAPAPASTFKPRVININ